MEELSVLGLVALIGGLIGGSVVRNKRALVCPSCGARKLAVVRWVRWAGDKTSGTRTEYHCGGCAGAVFKELNMPLMTKVQHDIWLAAVHAQDMAVPPPVARVHRKPRWWW